MTDAGSHTPAIEAADTTDAVLRAAGPDVVHLAPDALDEIVVLVGSLD